MAGFFVFNVDPKVSDDTPAMWLVGAYYVPEATDPDDAVDRVLKACGCAPGRYAVSEATFIDRR